MIEAVTLAHVARPLAALRGLGATNWTSVIACDPRARTHLDGVDAAYVPLASIPSEQFLDRLRRGAPVYDTDTLRRYVEADLEVFRHTRPDLVIGDFRLSLSASARLARVPYATLASACWSPHYRPSAWPVPELPLTRLLPIEIAGTLFRIGRPIAFAAHARSLNRVRRDHGLPSLGMDLRRVYTDADYVLYTDIPELYPMHRLPPTHRFVGPALWEPPSATAIEWPATATGRAIVYVTLGSSGPANLLPAIVASLGAMPVTALIATAGRIKLERVPANAQVTDMLPGVEAASRSDLVVCNGGSLVCYQALAAGKPVIGIPSNLDQFLNMQAIERAGAGLSIRADRLTERGVTEAVHRALADDALRSRAREIAKAMQKHRIADGMRGFLDQTFGPATG